MPNIYADFLCSCQFTAVEACNLDYRRQQQAKSKHSCPVQCPVQCHGNSINISMLLWHFIGLYPVVQKAPIAKALILSTITVHCGISWANCIYYSINIQATIFCTFLLHHTTCMWQNQYVFMATSVVSRVQRHLFFSLISLIVNAVYIKMKKHSTANMNNLGGYTWEQWMSQ